MYSICWCMYWMMKLMTCSNCLNSKMPKLPIENLAGKPPSGQNTRNNSIHEAFSLAGLRNYCLSHLKYGQQPSYGCMFCRLCTYIFVCTCAYVCVCVRAIHYWMHAFVYGWISMCVQYGCISNTTYMLDDIIYTHIF